MLELLAGAALRSLILAAAVGTGLRLRRAHNPRVSLAAWTLVLAASLLMPIAMQLTPIALPNGIIPEGMLPKGIIPKGIIPKGIIPGAMIPGDVIPDGIIPSGQLSRAPESLTGSEALPGMSDAQPGAPASLSDPETGPLPWRAVTSLLYLAVAGVLVLRLVMGLSLSWRIARAASPIREDWARGYNIRVSRHVDAPATFGSVILLPGDYAAWTPAKRLAVLAHEGAHVARRDFAIQLAASVYRAIFWFNPFSWWLRRHLSDLAEAACDDAAIAGLGDRFGYAEILLEISGRVAALPSTVSMARPAAVASRIERILSETPLSACISRRDRATLAGSIVPPAVLLSFLMVQPAPPLQQPVSDWAPAEVGADEGAADAPKQSATARVPAIAVASLPLSVSTDNIVPAPEAMDPLPLGSTEPLATPPRPPVAAVGRPPSNSAEAVASSPAHADPIAAPPVSTEPLSSPSALTPACTPRTEVASPSPFMSERPFRSSAASRDSQPSVPHALTRNAFLAAPVRATRQPDRTADNQRAPDQLPGVQPAPPEVRVSYSPNGTAAPTGAAAGNDQSPLFKRVVNETCMGNYVGPVATPPGIALRFYPVRAQFFRGPGDAPWVLFNFGAQAPANVPVTVRGSELKFTGASGMTYTLLPSRNLALPPRYHRLIGSAEHPSGGTIDFACGKTSRSS